MRNLPTSAGTIAKWRLICCRPMALLLVVLMCSDGSSAYSVLTHEEIVDLVWGDPRLDRLNTLRGGRDFHHQVRPIYRFPQASRPRDASPPCH
jgi:hypothetical protein